MKTLLIVDDQGNDLRNAAKVAAEIGVTEIRAQTTVLAARSYLEKGLQGEATLPDGILLDLDLGLESGFELLRFWHSTPRLNAIPMVVWSVLEEQQQVCDLFKVNSFVSKWRGLGALGEALTKLYAEN